MNYYLLGFIIIAIIILLIIIITRKKEIPIVEAPLKMPLVGEDLYKIKYIEIKNTNYNLELVEVEVFDENGLNIATQGNTIQSSTMVDTRDTYTYNAEYAVDGKFLIEHVAGTPHGFSSTNAEKDNWWRLELKEPTSITKIILTLRDDMPDLTYKLNGGKISFMNANNELVKDFIIDTGSMQVNKLAFEL